MSLIALVLEAATTRLETWAGVAEIREEGAADRATERLSEDADIVSAGPTILAGSLVVAGDRPTWIDIPGDPSAEPGGTRKGDA